MENIVFLILRRMRAPLLALIIVYALAALGLVLIPGQDADGNPWRMGFFHALYFVSFMSTTIGFGEIPYAFTDGQRLWVMYSIYATVVVWIYSIGTLIALLQDATFQQAIVERRFARRIRFLREPFYLVCGYGETGSALVHALTERDQHAVAIDIKQERVNLLQLENLRQYVPALCGDAGRPIHLLEAGLKHKCCAGVVALTNFNDVNLKIAITAKLLHPEVTVICRADSHDFEENMASFGTDHIFDPFDTFATHLATGLQTPGLSLLQEWLTSVSQSPLGEPTYPPKQGLWVLCGYGRFGKAIYARLKAEGVEVIVIEATPENTGTPKEGCVTGWGTEAVTLEEAEIKRAVGLVAGTDNDANNLSIVMTARQLNPKLFVVARENQIDNHALFNAVAADITMHPSSVIANRIRVLLATPLLFEFIGLAKYQDDYWACELVSRIIAMVHREVPEVWETSIDSHGAHAVVRALETGQQVTLADLIRDPREREQDLPCFPLMLLRHNGRELLPAMDTVLQEDDRLLFCGRRSAGTRMEWSLQNVNALSYLRTGNSQPQGMIWRLFSRLSRPSQQLDG